MSYTIRTKESLITPKVLFFVITFAVIMAVGAVTFLHKNPVMAASAAGFNAGNIIDDVIFTNKDAMNVQQIQTFLNSKVPVCDTNGTQTSELGGGTRAQYAANASLHPIQGAFYPPFTCLKDYSENGLSSAQIIYNLAQQYQINPQVLIVLLQKEQSLVTDTWPSPTQYKTATGYGCPDTAPCDSQYFGLTNQLTWSAKMFRAILNSSPTWYTPYILGNNYIQYSPNASCGGTTVTIQNRSTQALYNYTPYQPNQASLNAGYGDAAGDCDSHGNRNFYLYFNDWFGSTYAYISNGVNYSPVFDPTYYASRNPDIASAVGTNPFALFTHFINSGMREGRVASPNFDVIAYRNGNPDLRWNFGTNLPQYYWHYIVAGQREGRNATGPITLQPVTVYGGVDYSSIYDFNTYMANNGDLRAAYANNDTGALWHFVTVGMAEGRVANSTFDVTSYKKRYPDLRNAFGNTTRFYFMHYLSTGKNEGRTATGDFLGGTTVYRGVDYASVYSFDFYEKQNPDIQNAFGLADLRALEHFVNSGMVEGRQGISTFNVSVYKANYGDLRIAFGNNLKNYYIHYITTGKAEGRTAT